MINQTAKKIFFIIISLIILSLAIFFSLIIITNNEIIENNYKCIQHYNIDAEWCNCIDDSIKMLNKSWRQYIPSPLFDNANFLEREVNLHKYYCE